MATAIDETQRYNATRLGPPSIDTTAAFNTPRESRNPQQQLLLKQRNELEKRTLANKGEVVGGIGQALLDEEKAAQQGTRDAMAGVALNQSRTAALAARGYGPDGEPMAPGQTFASPGAGAPMASSPASQYQSPASAQYQSPAGQPQPQQGQPTAQRGFAMRKMPDGQFKTSSTINQATGKTEQRLFTTRDQALAFYGAGPAAAPAGGATAGVQIAQQQPPAMQPEGADSFGYGSNGASSTAPAQPSSSFRPGTPLGADALMRTPNRSAQPIAQPGAQPAPQPVAQSNANATQELTNYLTNSIPQSGPAGPQNMVQDRISEFAQSQAPMAITQPRPSVTAMGTAGVRTPQVQAAQAAPVPAAAPAPVAAAPQSGPEMSDSSGYGSMPSTSRFASPTTKMKQTSKKMGTPRADAGTQDFFSSIDDYGF